MTETNQQTQQTQPAQARTDVNIWPGIAYDDPHAARAWLRALGFTDGILVPGEGGDEQGGEVQHSEMLWPDGGRVMVHSRGKADDTFDTPRGGAAVYVVVTDPHAVHGRAERLGATFVRPLEETDYGSTGFSITDPEGNRWSFGTYAG